ncbi:MAG: hypothetical protein J1E16_08360 [Muribaculaceae bacterium]|nr:hypothetical protein [Muribaculaceae bacterium]
MGTRVIVFVLLLLSIGINIESKTLNWNRGRGYEPFLYAMTEGILIDNSTDTLKYDYVRLPNPTQEFSLRFRGKNINGNPLKKYSYVTGDGKKIDVKDPHWGFFITCEKDTMIFSVKGNEIQLATESLPCLEISYYNLGKGTKETINLRDKVNPYDGDNIWQIKTNDNNLQLFVGDKSLNQVYECRAESPITRFGFFAGWGAGILISDIQAEYDEGSVADRNCNFMEEIEDYLNESEDPMEGYWTLFDRELEESLIKLGGRYDLVCVKEGEGYVFLYLDGANVNSQNWKPGDLKATLIPTPFSDIYEVEWIDAVKEQMTQDIKAQKGEGDTLSIQFPYQSSKIRLRKIPKS